MEKWLVGLDQLLNTDKASDASYVFTSYDIWEFKKSLSNNFNSI